MLKQILLTLSVALFSAQSFSCFSTENTPPDEKKQTEIITLFYSTSSKKSIRMGLSIKNQSSIYYNFFLCNQFKDFNIREANTWDQDSCIELSKYWLPVSSLPFFKGSMKHQLKDSIGLLNDKLVKDPLFIALDKSINPLVNMAIGTSLFLFADKYQPQSRAQRFYRTSAKGSGVFLIVSALFGGFISIYKDLHSENIYHEKIKELSNLIRNINEQVQINIDIKSFENFKSINPTLQIQNIFQLLMFSIMESTRQTYESTCLA